ncbi:MAG: GldG family protein [Bacteroidetes bacterium]|nr:GldG family protein [Bacteroidota bacterium]
MKKISFKVKHAAISVAISLAVLVGLLLINLLTGEIDLDFDMTKRDIYTLTEESNRLLDDLENPVTLYYLTKPGQENITVFELLKQYESYKNVSLESVDPDRNPALISRYTEESGEGEDQKSIAKGSVIVVSGGRSRVVPSIDLYNVSYTEQGGVNVYGFKAEQSISAAIQYTSTGKQITIYQLLGHDEYTFDDFIYTDSLEKSNFTLNPLNMTTAGAIPEDADIIAILSPSWDYSQNEINKIQEFLERGGSLYAAFDLIQADLTNLSAFLASWNINMMKGIIMEQDTNRLIPEFGSSPVVFAPIYVEEEIAQALIENKQSMIISSSIGFAETGIVKRNVEFFPILSSTNKSWFRIDLNASSPNRIITDKSGPIYTAAGAAEKNIDTGFQEGAKILVLGSAQSFTPLPDVGSLKANFDFTLAALGWLAGGDKAINIQSRSLYQLPLQLSAANAFIYAGIVVILIPFGIILAGLIVYLRRKRL